MVFTKDQVDYSLYLVTDSTMLPPGATLSSQVEEGLMNGVTLVQIREKDCDTKNFFHEGVLIKKLCTDYNVPLIVNDRVDVALAIRADGVHVGQDDMPIPVVRELLGPDKIIGWSVSKVEEVEKLANWGPGMVDNIGIGMVFPTQTKKNPKKSPMGTAGVIKVLDALENCGASWVKTVAIGGLHPDNIQRVLYQCSSTNGRRYLDGIAVVSDIMASEDAGLSTRILRDLLDSNSYKFVDFGLSNEALQVSNINAALHQVHFARPLVQHMTNKVHQNFGANVTLAVFGSPIMSEVVSEVKDLSNIPYASLLINTGTIAPLDVLKAAVTAYNESKRPVVLDPVGYSATPTRMSLNNDLLSYGQFSCIKCNASEMLSLAELSDERMKGVDSSGSNINNDTVIKATKIVAYRYKTIAVCTGEYDFIANGTMGGHYSLGTQEIRGDSPSIPCFVVHGGNIPIMGDITASGCSLGSTITSFLGSLSFPNEAQNAVIAAVTLYKAAGKLAASRCKGSGSFQVEFIDALYQLSRENIPEKWDVKYELIL
ncbi:hypothetical protein Kpol_1002p43 [Vanderwaltozyma polyspora DSM 70294]|uniref:Thiamine phosphate synthase/TenI domain-containing protein n=1 Tax=Vanderwaltozyma polyspora (strain ATCC 22028 / DSM 70294 / BCRC 21397 / CBS 2163 / NBRC 10782 / NRRL Y-8283 / UCD 57-17) TaxID=436907 RepID=A7TE74_VANPO|nr:uncharacterized protein Kpol_1002p43 [Vanderwaltozyma polyspora DSM 70294]EDO19396.1 hypothetical protein Kpol_1002p43 [Vanderwaltozyma polyspora DSM 70294]